MRSARPDRVKKLEQELAETRIRHTQIQAKLLKLHRWIEEGRLVSRSDVERGLAQRASAFRIAIEDVVLAEAETLVQVLGGDPDQVPSVIDALFDVVEEWLDQFAEDRSWTVRVPAHLVECAQWGSPMAFGAHHTETRKGGDET